MHFKSIFSLLFSSLLIFGLSGCGDGAAYMRDDTNTTVPANTAPVIALIGENPMILNVGDTFTDPGATATDKEDGDLTAKIVTTGTVDTSKAGTYQITYTVTDSAGNKATVVRNVVVKSGTIPPSNTPPVITLNGANPMNLNVGDTFTDPGATATDKEDGDLTAKIVTTGTVDTSKAGTYQITYTVTDSAGNKATVVRNVVVKSGTIPPSNTPPVITLNGANPMNLNVGDTFTDPGATANDKEDGDITSKIVVTGTVDTTTAGTYTLTYTITDSGGLSATTTRTVNVQSKPSAPPTLTLLPFCSDINYTIDKNRHYNIVGYLDPGATAQDDLDGDITANISVTGGPVDVSVVKDYTLTYSITDSSSNTVTATRVIRVVEANIFVTGQTKSYDTAGGEWVDKCSLKDDGFYQSGIATQFTSGTDIVTDNVTGLIWEDGIHVETNTSNPDLYCQGLSLNGITWRVPEVWELLTIADKSKYDSGIDPNFQHVRKPGLGYTWANTKMPVPHQGNNLKWLVSFLRGLDVDDAYSASHGFYGVRCVNGTSQPNPATAYQKDSNTKIVSNGNTGLEWVDNDITGGVKKTWEDAIAFCESLTTGGYTDWRLPNINEYYSIFNYENNEIDAPFDLSGTHYIWSSTSSAQPNYSTRAWVMKQSRGDSSPKSKSNPENFMCVRNQ